MRNSSRVLKKSLNAVTWCLIIFLGINLIARSLDWSISKEIQSSIDSINNNINRTIIKTIFKEHYPFANYVLEDRKQSTLSEKMIYSVLSEFPVFDFIKEIIVYDPQMKDPTYDSVFNSSLEAIEPIIEPVIEPVIEPIIVTETESSTSVVEETVPAVEIDVFAPTKIGTEYSLEKLSDYDFLVHSFYSISAITTIPRDKLNGKELVQMDLSMVNGNQAPQILIYHTHSQEAFIDSVEGDVSDTVVGVGEYLAQILREQYGYNVIHNTDSYDLIDGVFDRGNKAYTYAYSGIEEILQTYPTIEVVLDVHRDGVRDESIHFVTEVNGKPTAKIMFVNGISRSTSQGEIDYLYNPYIKENLAFSLQLQLRASAYYPEFARRIMINAYRYNLQFKPKSALIEVGAQTNTVEEAMNAMEPLAVMIDEVLK
ncbi:MAG: stage II sporulation protein P [Clostridiales bacterium]|nr:stage II sporulation protein P [Clostridiales bacterium]